ncbi:MAG: hypothetical protein A3I11_02350 [Elusimicrobia bacterium RIFCSPLOWO2_02_FULL_39_32]|nr:MAG: hypothetical protein A2034_03700 [Elusimicrobia bacterium GWA2_38_7]OGR78459.1 MAG: hypothetical protein A3B80_07235 [Elusimicrobia bacterium RIFCSPHIGHO2_02_FULL_39_36]OGR92218.1 MAG: hypothetical protein A3I11_02350 [Elusimicrobia bacterium RIFCSPLOWO2_02_FULL_39_32]OGR99915.1 MAG: hypothetical protein A3G85_03090 [Elusimicrobia bacterium RIFCSPLOWO2_12_FULL_39_28]
MIQIKVIHGIILFILIAFLLIFGFKNFQLSLPIQNSLMLAAVLSCFNGIASFLSLNVAWKKSNAMFFGVFFSNLAWKMLVLGFTAFFIFKNQDFDLVFALIGLVLFTFLFTGLGITLILKNVCGDHRLNHRYGF